MRIDRRSFMALGVAATAMPAHAQGIEDLLTPGDEPAERLRAVLAAVDGAVIFERGFNGFTPDRPTNVKSASKSVISCLVGMAIDRGVIEGVDQRVAELLPGDLPAEPDARFDALTVGHLLSMQAGLARMSGPNYGRWVSSANWVRTALAAPFVAAPGGQMLYSTASTHLLSAILTRAAGRSTLALAREWLGPIDGFEITGWDRDPQGIYLGGNQMAMSTRSLLAFGELYRRGGVTVDGTRLLPGDWIEASWTRRTRSRWTGDGYGYGWFIRPLAGTTAYYGWGYGGQMIYVLPERGMTIAITSDPDRPSARTGYRDRLHDLAGTLVETA